MGNGNTAPGTAIMALRTLRARIERVRALETERDESDFAAHVCTEERQVHADLAACAHAGWRRGAGETLCHSLADWRDAVIVATARRAGALMPGCAVVAVGGYGRRELAPASDLDILVLYRGADTETRAIGAFLRQLWDLGYSVSASVRTPREAVADARGDPHLLTSILAGRPVAGDAQSWTQARYGVERLLGRRRRSFLAGCATDLAGIVARAGGDVLLKEPNLKTSPGGLRSVHLIGWLSLALGLPAPRDALRPRSRARLDRARDFLLYLRSLLHFLASGKEDILRMEHQHAVAHTLRIRGDPAEMMVRLMRHYYDRATDVVLCLLELSDHLARGRHPATPRGPPDAARALEAAAVHARRGGPPTGALVSYLAKSARATRGEPQKDRALFLGFRDLLRMPHAYPALSVLKLSGLLYAYLTPLRGVRNRVLHNPFHRYTVDQHSLVAVHELESFPGRATADPERFELPAAVCARYPETLWVVKLTLLLHDAGKAYGGDHSKNGAEMARTFLRELPTEGLIKEMVVYLVENHLLLSTLTRRGRPGEPAALEDLASEIFRSPYPQEALDFLYLLTCADGCATNERGYTPYHAAALSSLYRQTAAILAREQEVAGHGPASGPGPARRENDGEDDAFARALGPIYARTTPPQEIHADRRLVRGLEPGRFELKVSLYNDHLKVKILAADRPGLFSLFAGILLVNGADIVRATIHTYRGTAIDLFVVTEVHGNEILEREMEKELDTWVRDVRASFERFWTDAEELERIITGIEARTRPAHPAFLRESVVRVGDLGQGELKIDLTCTDRPALLYDVARRISTLGLDVVSAGIDTTGWYVHDSFVVRTRMPLNAAGMEHVRREVARSASPRPGP